MKALAAILMIAATLPAAASEIGRSAACPYVSAFAAAPLSKDKIQESAPYRSATFRVLPGLLMFADIRCEGSDGPADKLCGWLSENTSREFTELLPEQILGCYGFTFPLLPNVGSWKATYDLYDEKSARSMLLEIVRGEPGWNEDDVRLTVFRTGADDATNPLPPLPGQPHAATP